jgi:hypothetical protein
VDVNRAEGRISDRSVDRCIKNGDVDVIVEAGGG